jgi:hypothetical protein
MIIEGQAIAEIDGVQHRLDTNDTTWIPASVPHRFINATDRPMRISWICASVDATRTMMATGEERTIDAEHSPPDSHRKTDFPGLEDHTGHEAPRQMQTMTGFGPMVSFAVSDGHGS